MWLTASCLVFVGCGGSNAQCDSFSVLPALIAVTNAATNAPICAAEVTASGPNGELPLSVSSANEGSCEYAGPRITGSFTVTISKAGFQTATLTDVSGTIQSCDGPKLSSQIIPVKLTEN